MSLIRTYTVKMQSGDIWQFKYNLNGVLIFFSVLEGELSEKQEKFLYLEGKFPWKEIQIQNWSKIYKHTTVEIGDPDLSFKALWHLYDHKLAKFHAEKSFDKLKDADKIKCFLAIPAYKKYLASTKIAQAHLATYINGRYYENEYK
jgi:hypothetical protein